MKSILVKTVTMPLVAVAVLLAATGAVLYAVAGLVNSFTQE